MHDVAQDNDGEITEKQIPLLRYYLVWNVEQIEGLDLPQLETREVDVIPQAEAIITSMPNPLRINHDGGDKAFYLPLTDSIHLPNLASFESAGEYYATLFHELSHATGHRPD